MSIFISYLDWFNGWANPWLWVSISGLLFLIGLLGTSPLYLPKMDTDSATLQRIITVKIRQYSLFALGIYSLLIPFFTWLIGQTVHHTNKELFSKMYGEFLLDGYLRVWEMPFLGVFLGWGISHFYKRFVSVEISALKRKFSMKQSGEELSDIRIEGGEFKTKNFNPVPYYKENHIFIGLDEKNKPIFLTMKEWESTHQRLVGPTQVGKGVEIGVQLDQAIRANKNVFFIDPKPDRHARAIMKKACEDTGRRFIELDLNGEGNGNYHPFLSGLDRDRRSRLIYMLGLMDTGEQADFYKANERKIIDLVFKEWDGTLKELLFLLKQDQFYDETKRSVSYINEWLTIKTFNGDKRRTGFSVERSLVENAVVYIKGNLDDDIINKACTLLLTEIVQEVKRLDQVREHHTFIAVDEVAFLITDKIADALATVASFKCNILLAYQAEGDLLNLKDKTLNPRAIESRVKINCKISLYYMAVDFETAKKMADDSGTIQKAVTRSQSVDIGRHMEETWSDKRDIHRVEESLITANKAKMLPERVGVLYRPAKIAVICFTAWVPIDIIKYGKEELKPIIKSTVLEEKENLEEVSAPKKASPVKRTIEIDDFE